MGTCYWLLHFFSIGCVPKTVAPASPETKTITWGSPVGQFHPLVGKWWSPAQQRFLEEPEVKEQVGKASFVLLGEKHDNIDHHRMQAQLLGWVAQDRQVAVAFEMLSDQSLVDNADQSDPLAFAKDVGWSESGWPEFEHYAPIFNQAIANKSPILAANPPKSEVMASMQRKPDILVEAKALSPEGLKELKQEIIDAHCGHANEQMTEVMVTIQRLKDVWMTQVLLDNQSYDAVVLIAGNGHTRFDRGVPWYFPTALSDQVISISFREIVEKVDSPQEFGQAADLVYFTPRVDNIDPCEKFREELEKMGNH